MTRKDDLQQFFTAASTLKDYLGFDLNKYTDSYLETNPFPKCDDKKNIFKKEYVTNFQKYINQVTSKLICNSNRIGDSEILHNFTPSEILNNLDFFADKMDNNITAGQALYSFNGDNKND